MCAVWAFAVYVQHKEAVPWLCDTSLEGTGVCLQVSHAEGIWWLSFKSTCWNGLELQADQLCQEFRGTQEKQMVVGVPQT